MERMFQTHEGGKAAASSVYRTEKVLLVDAEGDDRQNRRLLEGRLWTAPTSITNL